jgi:menaquinone-dependent protoporphyrinogen oxidase
MKALIVYGTWMGSTGQIAEEMGKTLSEQGYEVTVKNAGDVRGVRVQDFDLVIVGSAVRITRWKGEATKFLKSNEGILAGKKVALFASGNAGGDPALADYAKKSIDDAASRFPSIRPVALAYFGGRLDFSKPDMLMRVISGPIKKDLEKKGIDTSKPYDARDWDAIRQWARDVAEKGRSQR